MDDRSFDRLARLLGEARDRRTGLKALVGGLLGAGCLAALDESADATRKRRTDGPAAERRKKRKKCNPACAAGFACVRGRCACASGVTCGTACCASGQVCRDGACADPRPACLAFGAECKETGRPCCDGLTCASGQDGSFPVTCLRAKGAACASTAECPFGMTCTGGRCLGNGGGGGIPTGQSCAGGEACAQPAATCTAYTTPGAPGGEYCALPLRKVCTGNPDCACYNCWYVRDGVQVTGRQGRAAPQKACIEPAGGGCATDDDCARGLTCDLDTKTCVGTQCAPAGAPCAGGVTCCEGSTCENGTCSGGGGGGKELGDPCGANSECTSGLCWYPQDEDGAPIYPVAKVCVVAKGGACDYEVSGYAPCGLGNFCEDRAGNPALNTCTDTYDADGDYPLVIPPSGACSTGSGPGCYDGNPCQSGTCRLAVRDECDPDNDAQDVPPGTACPTNATCRQYEGANANADHYCLLNTGQTCANNNDCGTKLCRDLDDENYVCTECLTDAACERIKSTANPPVTLETCKRWSCQTDGFCRQVAATNTICDYQSGTRNGYCTSGAVCAASATCDFTATGNTLLQVRNALWNAPYKSGIAIGGAFTMTDSNSSGVKTFTYPEYGDGFACEDNVYDDGDPSCTMKLPWNVTMVACEANTSISGGSTVNTASADPGQWTWTGGSFETLIRIKNLSFTLKGIDLKKTRSLERGAAINATQSAFMTGSVLTVENLKISENWALDNGGGIGADVTSVILRNAVFEKNRASNSGSGSGGAIYTRASSTMQDVTMTGNFAATAGTGIYTESTSVTCSGTNTIDNQFVNKENCSSSTPTTFTGCGCAATCTTVFCSGVCCQDPGSCTNNGTTCPV